MLRRALRRARLHLPAGSVGQEDGERPVELGDGAESASVAHTSLAFDAAVDEHFRRQSEDVEGLEDLLRALRQETKAQRRSSIERVGDEAQRAADAWTRLQRLYGLFQAMADDEVEPSRPPGRDQGLRSLLSEPAPAPAGVMLRDLRVLPRETQLSVSASPPQGFSAEVFLSLGDALYAEMLEASSTKQQHRFDHDALRELGDTLYAEAASQSVVPVSAC